MLLDPGGLAHIGAEGWYAQARHAVELDRPVVLPAELLDDLVAVTDDPGSIGPQARLGSGAVLGVTSMTFGRGHEARVLEPMDLPEFQELFPGAVRMSEDVLQDVLPKGSPQQELRLCTSVVRGVSPGLRKVCWDAANLVATDGYRMVLVRISVGVLWRVVLDFKALSGALAWLGARQQLRVGVGDGCLYLGRYDYSRMVRLPDLGVFPSYASILPKAHAHWFAARALDLRRLFVSACKAPGEPKDECTFRYSADRLELARADAEGVRVFHAGIPGEGREVVRLVMNVRFIHEAVRPLSGTVHIGMGDPLGAALTSYPVTVHDDAHQCTTVLMPVVREGVDPTGAPMLRG